ncbi:hypothetical protein L1987_80834 [Smallanthus sonchifolius]|uniref:Uncharacterized protein n=1 Tax=Smallanthus sonchifolius TaxID=185202 RepID=A0ACB8YPC5_9ASTR|nr:hypothetical protein L1987_80834 [Smallanthus sonchifolius]
MEAKLPWRDWKIRKTFLDSWNPSRDSFSSTNSLVDYSIVFQDSCPTLPLEANPRGIPIDFRWITIHLSCFRSFSQSIVQHFSSADPIGVSSGRWLLILQAGSSSISNHRCEVEADSREIYEEPITENASIAIACDDGCVRIYNS